MDNIEPTDDELFEMPGVTENFAEALVEGRERTRDINALLSNHTGDPLDIFSGESLIPREDIDAHEKEVREWEKSEEIRIKKEREEKAKMPKAKPKNWLVYEPPPEEPEVPKRSGPGRPKGSKNVNLSPAQKARIEAVTLMVSCGITQASISRLLGISKTTLINNYRKELDYGTDILTSRIANALIQKALDGNVAAQQFWLKARAGWKEPTQVEHTGKDGMPLVSGVEREQRMMAIMMGNPGIKAKLDARRDQKMIDVTPKEPDIEPDTGGLPDIF